MASPIRRQLRFGVLELADDRGSVTLERPASHVELLVGRGYASAGFAALILAEREQILREAGRIALFDDLAEVVGYDSAVRLELTGWSKANRARIVSFHILTASRILSMGIGVASLALGGTIRAHTRREPFRAALEQECIKPSPLRNAASAADTK